MGEKQCMAFLIGQPDPTNQPNLGWVKFIWGPTFFGGTKICLICNLISTPIDDATLTQTWG